MVAQHEKYVYFFYSQRIISVKLYIRFIQLYGKLIKQLDYTDDQRKQSLQIEDLIKILHLYRFW